jgi:hypothetical protein
MHRINLCLNVYLRRCSSLLKSTPFHDLRLLLDSACRTSDAKLAGLSNSLITCRGFLIFLSFDSNKVRTNVQYDLLIKTIQFFQGTEAEEKTDFFNNLAD